MPNPPSMRSFAQRVALLRAFAERVAALSPESWDRLRLRCAPLAGSTPAALLARSALTTAAYEIELPGNPQIPIVSAIRGVTRAVIGSLSLTKELVFGAIPSLDEPSRPRRESTGKPIADDYIDAYHTLRTAAAAAGPAQSGLSCVIEAAAQALLRKDLLSPERFTRIYQWIEPEIPIATLDVDGHLDSAAAPSASPP